MNWKKTIQTSIAMIGIVLGATTASTASTLAEIKDASVKFLQNGDDICSAVIVKANDGIQVYTAGHCIEGGGEFSILVERPHTLFGGIKVSSAEYAVEPVASSPWLANDFAILRFTSSVMPDLPGVDKATERDLQFGEQLIAVGYPAVLNDQVLFATTGLFVDYVSMEGKTGKYIFASVPIRPGFSGGGLYAKRGEEYILVGLASARPGGPSVDPVFGTWFSDVLSGVVMGSPGTRPVTPPNLDNGKHYKAAPHR